MGLKIYLNFFFFYFPIEFCIGLDGLPYVLFCRALLMIELILYVWRKILCLCNLQKTSLVMMNFGACFKFIKQSNFCLCFKIVLHVDIAFLAFCVTGSFRVLCNN